MQILHMALKMPMAIPTKLANGVHNSGGSSNNRSSSKLLLRHCDVVSTTTATARLRVQVRCSSSSASPIKTDQRRSGNWTPSLWDIDYIQSLPSDYLQDERHTRRACELITQVKKMLLQKETTDDRIRQLELIDDLQRLGLSDHFHNEFKEILNSIYLDNKYYNIEMMREEEEEESRDLYSTALAFRLLREHGFQVAQEVFECFKNEEGEFEASLSNDTRGILQLYEASFLLKEGENTLEIARDFSTKILQEKVDSDELKIEENYLLSSITYSLDVPIHWRIKRPNTSVWIDAYRKRWDMNPVVLELAILDSNIVQGQYQQQLQQGLRWWKDTCLVEKLPFARDRFVECYFWAVGFMEPRQHVTARIEVAKINALITTIDDVYDVYGTLQELEQFTEAFRRWDTSSLEQLPSYMQLCFLALDNFINQTAYDVLKDQGLNIIPYLRKSWRDLAEAYLIEAQWYYGGHKPKLREYLENSWRSIGGTVVLTHEFFRVTHSLTKEVVDTLYEYHDLVRWSSTIFRLADDLGTSVDEVSRGDVPKAIQCYMNDNAASEEEARQHVKWLIAETWKKMNEQMVSKDSPFCKDFIKCAADQGRISQFMYHHGDGHGIQNPKIHQQITTSLFQPFA